MSGERGYRVRHTRTGHGLRVRASFDVFTADGEAFRGSLVALGADDERDLAERLKRAFPGGLYGAASGPADSAKIDAEFGYGRPD